MRKLKFGLVLSVFLAGLTYYAANQTFETGGVDSSSSGTEFQMETIDNANVLNVAQAEEWECSDSAFPNNCNNGTCCESTAYCCSAHCCPSGSLCCPTGCCPSGYSWYCPENNRCYENSEEASVNCPSILQQCN